MSDTADVFMRHAHLAIPRFEVYRLQQGKRVYGNHLSDILVDDMGFAHVDASEEVRARFLCIGQGTAAVAEDGRPHNLDLRAEFGLNRAYEGATNVCVTGRRLIGVVEMGDSIWGQLGDERVLAWELDLRDIDSLALTSKSGVFGRKERPVDVHSYLPMMGVRLEVMAVLRVGRNACKEKSSRPLMQALSKATADVKMRHESDSTELARLARLADWDWAWDAEESEFVAEFDSIQDVQIDEAGRRVDRPHWTY